ncbi:MULTISPECIES: hypothetical protein [unclassified Bradyrhizobium]|uniref:hypothetical protein n=1 Tax=unclassified Bradyrhizobium TaxID=2631580 RepID=UPI002478F025|nr:MULTISPECIES: hypothetical protein [unclassified Bradyrhizobium]WGR68168.1 hypothetical protein MTX24_22235 [Bradyrhizobium sp. ISRA426]WGR80223.1 hypothetical protein MTX21_07350 [Bradyrhizobium sp. ISRA430]WGR83408.1 hypothetical protein MTX25_21915 [Bradyrhizobium sp. ISRA432]
MFDGLGMRERDLIWIGFADAFNERGERRAHASAGVVVCIRDIAVEGSLIGCPGWFGRRPIH